MTSLLHHAHELDATDPLREYRDRFLDTDAVAYLDGNSLGRPLRATAERMDAFIRQDWGSRLIRGWAEGWMDWPLQLGDRIARAALGAAMGQTVVADSTTVMLFKLASAALDGRPGRTEIVLDTDNFPTDRYVLEGIAATRDLRLRWITTDRATGVTEAQVAEAVGPNTALAVFSHTNYGSGYVADAAAITRTVHAAGGLVLWDLCHSTGAVPVELDAWDVDFAVGCTYKYLNGGPGAPAFGYVNSTHQDLRQPIWGWMGHADPFAMTAGYQPAEGIRSTISGTPPILSMIPLMTHLDLLDEVGLSAIREKSLRLTDFAMEFTESRLLQHGVELASPHEHQFRGSHITLRRADFDDVIGKLLERGVIPDFRPPDAIRIGLSPLSTSFAELHEGLDILATLLD